jgi:hypothetical protein
MANFEGQSDGFSLGFTNDAWVVVVPASLW